MILDALFGWALTLPQWLGILSLSAVITALMTLAYVALTDQKEMRRLKAELKVLQKDVRASAADPKKSAKIQKKLLTLNGEIMKKSLRPTLYTLIPVLFVFGWMAANFAFDPVLPGDEVRFVVETQDPARLTLSGVDVLGNATRETVESQVAYTLVAPERSVNITVTNEDGQFITRELLLNQTEGLISEARHEDSFVSSEIEYPKSQPFGDFEFFGYNPGWLFTYILFSLVLNVALRKAFNIA